MKVCCEDCGHWFYADPEHGGYGLCYARNQLTKYHEGAKCLKFIPDLQTIWNQHDPEAIEFRGSLRAMPETQADDYQTMEVESNV